MTTVITTQQAEQFAIDASHSNVEFVVRHLMISKVRGRFPGVSGTIEVQAGSDVPAAVAVEIDASSVDTREPQRDAHLRSADFFDAATFPELTYRSTRVEGTAAQFRVYGELTLHGVTKPVVLDGTFEGRGRDPWGNDRLAYSAHANLSRKDFGLTWNQALETGGVMVSDEVRIELNVEAVKRQ